ncbi:Scn11a, partial [Symbiodinium sp. KB8]
MHSLVKYSVMELRKWMVQEMMSLLHEHSSQLRERAQQLRNFGGAAPDVSMAPEKSTSLPDLMPDAMDPFLSWPGKGKGVEESQKKEDGATVFASITDVSARQPPTNSSQVTTQLSWMGQQKILINFGFIVFESDRDSKCYPDYAGRYDACPQRSELLEWLRLVNLTLLSVYTLEALCRAFVERSQYFCNRWNVVDLLAVLLGWPTVLSLGSGNLHLLRMVRFVRLIRALRVIISVPELYLLVTGFSSSIKAIIFGSLLLVAALVFWAVIAVEVLHPIISVLPYPD